MAQKPPETDKPSTTVAPETTETGASADYTRGARAAAESMKAYFQDENENAIYDVPDSELDSFEESAIADAIRNEEHRIAQEKRMAARR